MIVKSASNCRAEDLNKNKLEISVNYWPVKYALNSIERAMHSKNVFHYVQHRHDWVSTGRINAQPLNAKRTLWDSEDKTNNQTV